MTRLKRVDCSGPGIERRRRGRGFAYYDDGELVDDREILERIRELVIPPAWTNVWICPEANGHIQAIGMDAAGRRQYLYHPAWRRRRDAEKFEEMLEFARTLPKLRRTARRHLALDGLPRERVLACAVRLLDRGFFRIGSEDYAEQNGTFGLATMEKRHVRVDDGDVITFDYPAKGGRRRIQSIVDPAVAEVVAALKRRRGGGDDLLAYKNGRWVDIRSTDINEYIKAVTGGEFSAKDFRTWNATVLAAVALAVSAPAATSTTARKRAITRAVKETAHYLGNTPAVCRASYIDPRVFDRFQAGMTIGGALEELGDVEFGEPSTQGAIEEAVLDLLAGERSPAIERIPTAA